MNSYGDTPAAVHLDRSLVILWAGPEAESVLFCGRDPVERAAIHEAGHAVAGWRFGRGIEGAYITATGSGMATFGPMGASTKSVLPGPSITRASAGPPSNMRPASALGRPLSDVRRAVKVGRLLRADRKAAWALVRTRRFEARIFVNQSALLIRAVAAELLKAGQLTGVEIESIITRTVNEARTRRLREIGL
jgi:hypothetical protein